MRGIFLGTFSLHLGFRFGLFLLIPTLVLLGVLLLLLLHLLLVGVDVNNVLLFHLELLLHEVDQDLADVTLDLHLVFVHAVAGTSEFLTALLRELFGVYA